VIVKKSKPNDFQRRKILWIDFLVLDIHLHGTSFLEILKHLVKRGYDAVLVAVRSKSVFQTENPQVRIISVPLRYIPMISPVMFAVMLFFFLPFYVALSKPDFVITEPNISIIGFMSVLPFSKFKRTKFVLDVRSTPVETVGFRGFLQAFWFSVSVVTAKKLFDGITIITPQMKEEVCKRFRINPNLVGVWSSGVSTALFNPENRVAESKELRRRLGLSEKFVVFYHGVFSANRGLIETIDAMKILKGAYPNVVLFLLGTGPIAHMLKELIQKERLQDNIIIHDPVGYVEVPKYISISDVCIVPLPNHPYWRFQCPLKLLEHLAMKKVVIATNIPAHRSVIGREKCGIYISSIEPAEIAKAIAYTYENREKLAEWGASGRTIIEEKYRWEKVAENLESYMLSIED